MRMLVCMQKEFVAIEKIITVLELENRSVLYDVSKNYSQAKTLMQVFVCTWQESSRDSKNL